MTGDEFSKQVMPEGWVAATPRPSPGELAEAYARLYYQKAGTRESSYEAGYEADELAHKKLMADLCLHAIRRAARVTPPATARFLDVGCGEGFTLAAASDQGWLAQGIDFSSYAIAKFHPHLADAVQVGDAFALLQEIGQGGDRFDACVLLNVLEHVIDPAEMLHGLVPCLAGGGVIAITVPNDYSAVQEELLKLGHIEHEFWFSPPFHLSYFNLENGPRFVESLGFEVVDIFSGFPVDFFLFHPGANYVRDKSAGKAAYKARIAIDLLLARNGMDAFHQMAQATARCGAGRTFTMIVRPG